MIPPTEGDARTLAIAADLLDAIDPMLSPAQQRVATDRAVVTDAALAADLALALVRGVMAARYAHLPEGVALAMMLLRQRAAQAGA